MQEISFNHPVWNNVSAEGKDLISKLLAKDPKKRVSITEVLDHKWITNGDAGIKEFRRKSQDLND